MLRGSCESLEMTRPDTTVFYAFTAAILHMLFINPVAAVGDYSRHILYICISTEGNVSWQNHDVLIQSFILFFEASKYL